MKALEPKYSVYLLYCWYVYYCSWKLVDRMYDYDSCRRVVVDSSKVTSAVWGPLDEYIVTGHDNGALSQYNILDVCSYTEL